MVITTPKRSCSIDLCPTGNLWASPNFKQGTASPDQEVGEGGGDEDPGRPDVVLGVEEAFLRAAGVLAFHVASMVVAIWTLCLAEAVPHIILDLNGCQAHCYNGIWKQCHLRPCTYTNC